jgi:hypothetical protein
MLGLLGLCVLFHTEVFVVAGCFGFLWFSLSRAALDLNGVRRRGLLWSSMVFVVAIISTPPKSSLISINFPRRAQVQCGAKDGASSCFSERNQSTSSLCPEIVNDNSLLIPTFHVTICS